MARLKRYLQIMKASRDEACLAVRLYNDPVEVRSFEAFVVHMHVAWLYLLHAKFDKDGIDIRYRKRGNPRIFEKVDGEPKCWELSRCVSERWPVADDPIRRNIEFFIALRNKIEHRYARQQDALGVVLGGHAQALLLNYEKELSSEFGLDRSLAVRLRFPVFVGSFTDAGEQALRVLRSGLPASLRKFIAEYHAGLDSEISNDPRFELRLRVINELAPKDPNALALRFTRYQDMTEEQKSVVESLGRSGLVITRDRQRPVVGCDLSSPRKVVELVSEKIPYVFNMAHFRKAWTNLGVRPRVGVTNPEVTDERYCVYDARHGDYGYTAAYVKKLIRHCSTEIGFRRIIGMAPKDKLTGEWVGVPPASSIPPWSRGRTEPISDRGDSDTAASA